MGKKRVLITGMGVVSPVGIGKEEFWKGVSAGKSAFSPITLFDVKNLNVKTAGEIKDFSPNQILNEKILIDLDRATLLLLSAVKLALDDSNLQINNDNTNQTGVSVGTTFGNLHSLSRFDRESLTEGPRYANPSVFPSTVGNSPASRVSIKFQIKGFNATISTGMTAALDALNYGRDFLELDKIKTVVVGAVEDLSIQTFLGLYKLGYLSGLKDIDRGPLSCPFDRRREGIILSEGAVSLVLEDADIAKGRNAFVYAEVLGMGSCFDSARFYRYNPKGQGMIQSMSLALQDAGLKPEDIDCIFANANSTQDADFIETMAIKYVFGGYAYKMPITAVKSVIGETFSASGGFSIIAAIRAIKEGFIPAVMNYQQKDDLCDLNYVINQPLKKELSKVMVNAFGQDGNCSSLIIGR